MSRQTPNSPKNPVSPTLDNPIGIDRIIQTMQVAFTNSASPSYVSWISQAFGRAYLAYTKREPQENEIRRYTAFDAFYPQVWQGDGVDFLNVLANDNLNAYCFFRISDEPEESVEYQSEVQDIYEVGLHLIAWWDLSVVDPTRQDPFHEELIQDLKNAIKKTPFQNLDRVEINRVYRKPTQIFEGYTMDLVKEQDLVYPRGGVRIEMIAKYIEPCS